MVRREKGKGLGGEGEEERRGGVACAVVRKPIEER
jgi:hypothetical protein